MKASQVDIHDACMHLIDLHAPKLRELMKATQIDTHYACMHFTVLLTRMHQNVGQK